MKVIRTAVCALFAAALLSAAGTARGQSHVWVWGSDDEGQLGNGTGGFSTTPVQTLGMFDVRAVAGGEYHSLALKNDGTVWAWGGNYHGQLGDGTLTNRNLPVPVQNLSGVVSVACGDGHSLALKDDGTVWAWGINLHGELGNGTTTSTTLPVAVKNLSGAVAVSGGAFHSLAVKGDGTIWAWGGNGFGQLGDGTWNGTNLPVQVKNLSGVVAVAAGADHSIALKNDGTTWTFGRNEYGQLGNGTNSTSNLPVQVTNLSRVVAVAAGEYYSLALKDDGTVWAWGDNVLGALGNGTFTDSTLPVQVQNLSGVIAVAAGALHSLALKNDGTVWAWGYNGVGQLGDGTTNKTNLPVRVIGLPNVVAISAGSYHSIAIERVGTTQSTLTLASASGQFGNVATLAATLEDTVAAVKIVGRTVFFKIDGTDAGTATTDGNGVARYSFAVPNSMSPGSHPTSASFGGDQDYAPASANSTFTLLKGVTLTLSAATGQIGKKTTLHATLKDKVTGVKLAGRTVLFKIDGADVGTTNTDSNGVAQYVLAVPEGTAIGSYPTVASFGGDQDYAQASASSTLSVSKGKTSLGFPNRSGYPGQTITFSATLKNGGGTALSGQTISFSLDGDSVGSATTDSSGKANLSYTIPANAPLGTHTLTASFGGDSNYLAASKNATLTVSRIPVKVTVYSVSGYAGNSVNLSAKLLDASSAPMLGVTLSFTVNGTLAGTVNTDGTGKAIHPYAIPAGTAAGTYPIAVTYAGDATHLPSTKSGTLTVK